VGRSRSANSASIAARGLGAWLLVWASAACWVGIGHLIGAVFGWSVTAELERIDIRVVAALFFAAVGMVVAIPFAMASAVVVAGLALAPFHLSVRGAAVITSIANGLIGAVGTLALVDLSSAYPTGWTVALVLMATGAGLVVGVPLGMGAAAAATSRTSIVDEALSDLIGR
jgi:hypothetical protein